MVHGSVDVAEEVHSQLSSLKGVSGIVVKQRHEKEFEVAVYLSDFSLDVRRSIYAQERSLYKQFSNVFFDFLVVADSEKADATSHQG